MTEETVSSSEGWSWYWGYPTMNETRDIMEMPEANLWSAVILQLLKEAQTLYDKSKKVEKSMQDKRCSKVNREQSFTLNCKVYDKIMVLKRYIESKDFHMVCDFSRQEYYAVKNKILEILRGDYTICEKQVKRSFTRKQYDKGI